MPVDFLQKSAGNSASTTLSASISDSDTSFPLTSDTNFLSGGGLVIVDEGQANEELAYYTGKSGSSLTVPLANRGLEGGSAQAHNAGATVKGIFSADMWNNAMEALALVASTTTGELNKATGAEITTGTSDVKIVTPKAIADSNVSFTDGTETLTNKTLTSPKINEDVAVTSTATELNNLHSKTVNLGAWTAFTPSWTNLTVGAGGTNAGFYCQIGKTVHLRVKVILGTSPSVGAVKLTLPVTIKNDYGTLQTIGNVVLKDTDAGVAPIGTLGQSGDLYYSKVSSTVSVLWNLGSSEPFTWAASDEIMITATYEAA